MGRIVTPSGKHLSHIANALWWIVCTRHADRRSPRGAFTPRANP